MALAACLPSLINRRFTTGDDRMTHSLPDEPPLINAITPYDEAHFAVYLRLLDAKAAGVHWPVAAQYILGLDPERQPGRSKRIWRAHLIRAEWMTRQGYKHLLQAQANQ